MKLFTSHRPKPAKAASAGGNAQARPARREEAPGEPKERPAELGGPAGPEPTRYGDWERKGICYDF